MIIAQFIIGLLAMLGVVVGTRIRTQTAPLSRSAPTDIGVLHITGIAMKGPVDKTVKIENMAQFEKVYGTAIATSSLYWQLYWLFQEGLRDAFVSRVFGAGAATATATLSDGAGITLNVAAKNPGIWGNTLNIVVQTTTDDASIGAGQYRLVVTDDVLGTLETSPIFTTVAEAISWSQTSDYIILTAGVNSGDPVRVVAPGTSLAGGTDGAALTDADWLAAVQRHTRDDGPGQLAFADRTSTAGHQQLLDHAVLTNRFALLDHPDTTSKATLLATAAAVRTYTNARFGALYGPWLRYPGPTTATPRNLPASTLVAAAMARNDAAGVSPNQPSGGDLGDSRFAFDVKAKFPLEADRGDLNDGSVNLILLKNGLVRIYGNRTLVSKDANPDWYQASNARFYMKIAAQADNILEGYVLKQIDGRRVLFSQLRGEVIGMLMPYFENGSLYGETAEEAFYVDTDTVNTDATIANNEINVSIQLVMSNSGETVTLNIIKQRITG
jgi:hypothetical protein